MSEKITLTGIGGFIAMGLVTMPFIPKVTLEQNLADGQRCFADRCSDVTRNRRNKLCTVNVKVDDPGVNLPTLATAYGQTTAR